MGQITIKTTGSFGDSEANYSAQEGGHAYALSRALFFILQKVAKAISLDHALHTGDEHPEISDFGKKAPK